jgi:hypothetical protein
MALTKHNRLTVGDLRNLNGKRQLTMLFVETPDEAAAACPEYDRNAQLAPIRISAPAQYPPTVSRARLCLPPLGMAGRPRWPGP